MTYAWLPFEDSIRRALERKRRLRLIYKWRHGLAHTHQPTRRDRGKLQRLALYGTMRLDPLAEEVVRPLMESFAASVVRDLMGSAD